MCWRKEGPEKAAFARIDEEEEDCYLAVGKDVEGSSLGHQPRGGGLLLGAV